MIPRGRGAVVAHGHREEVEHQVRIGDVVVAPGKPSAFEMVGRRQALLEQDPLQPDPRAVPPLQPGRHRHGLGAGVLHVHLQVVLKVLAHARQPMADRNARGLQVGFVSHTRDLEQLRRVDGPAAEDDLAPGDVVPTVPGELDARCP